MKKLNLFFYAVLACAVIASCSGDDGDPGPKGDTGTPGAEGPQGEQGPEGEGLDIDEFTNGQITATLSGTRRSDGEPFNETIACPYIGDTRGEFDSFYEENGNHTLYLSRASELTANNWVEMDIVVTNLGQENQFAEFAHIEAELNKKTGDGKIFSLYVETNFQEAPAVFFPVSAAVNNSTYHFKYTEFEQDGNGDRYASLIYDYNNGQDEYYFATTDGSKVYFEHPNTNYDGNHDITYGNFLRIVSPLGEVSNTSGTYGALKYSRDGNNRDILLNGTFTPLQSEVINVENDEQEITNFSYDPATGALSFDYSVVFNNPYFDNSTGAPVTITGTVNATVYNEVVNKKPGNLQPENKM